MLYFHAFAPGFSFLAQRDAHTFPGCLRISLELSMGWDPGHPSVLGLFLLCILPPSGLSRVSFLFSSLSFRERMWWVKAFHGVKDALWCLISLYPCPHPFTPTNQVIWHWNTDEAKIALLPITLLKINLFLFWNNFKLIRRYKHNVEGLDVPFDQLPQR